MLRAHTSRRWLAAGLTLASIVLAACEADRVFDPGQSGYALLTPPSAQVLVGASVPLAARVVRNGTDTITVNDAIWRSSDTTVATVIAGPAVKAKKAGNATIFVDWSAQRAQMTLTVENVPVASVRLAPTSVGMVPGDTRTIVATPLDGSGNALTGRAVTWSSSNSSVATVAGGTITAVAVGTASIVASIEGITASAPVTVTPAPVFSVSVSLNAPSVSVGQSVQATAVLRDTRDQVLTGRTVTWSSNNTSVATVDAAGLVRAVGAGTANISASSEGVQGQAALAVTAAAVSSIVLQPATFTINVGATQQVQATTRDAGGNVLTGRTVTWSSNNTAVATVDGAGLVRGIAGGSATITATSEGVTQQATATVVAATAAVPSVSPSTATVYIGGSTTLTAVMRDAGGTTVPATFSWSSSNTSVATVDASGRVTGVSSGSATITATADGKSASALVTVAPVPVASVTISPTSLALQAGATGQLTATCRDSTGAALTGRSISWGSNATGVATVNAVGLVTAVAAGTTQAVATCEGGRTGSATVTVSAVPVASVTVTPSTATVRVGSTVSLAATTRDASGNTLTGRTVTWSSSSTAIATVSSSGVVTPVTAGSATITATSEGRTGTSAITVQPAAVASVTLSPGALSLVAGNSGTLTATARDASGNAIAGATFTWSTDDAATATVANGVVTAVRVGSTVVRATSDGVGGSASVSVSAAPTTGTTVDPTLLPLAIGQTPSTTSTYGRGLSAGQTYQDANTSVTVLKVTDARTPVANSGMYSGYSEGGPNISQAWTGTDGNTYYTLWLAWGDGWFVDIQYPSLTMSNWRAAPSSGETGGTWSLNPATPRIFYYAEGSALNRWDTQANRLANTGSFPVSFSSAGSQLMWLQTQLNDTWIVGMMGSNNVVVGVRPSDGLKRTITGAAYSVDIDEPHIDREQPVVYLSINSGAPNKIVNLATGASINPVDPNDWVNDDHNAPMRGKIVGISWQANATVIVDYQGRVTKVPGTSPTNWNGDYHMAGQWVFNNPSDYFMVDQWQTAGNYPIRLGMVGLVNLAGDVRLLVAHDAVGGGYQSGGQPHPTFAPDGKLVMWTSNMNRSSRFDVFLAKVPTR